MPAAVTTSPSTDPLSPRQWAAMLSIVLAAAAIVAIGAVLTLRDRTDTDAAGSGADPESAGFGHER